jgi:hypothetical protein
VYFRAENLRDKFLGFFAAVAEWQIGETKSKDQKIKGSRYSFLKYF